MKCEEYLNLDKAKNSPLQSPRGSIYSRIPLIKNFKTRLWQGEELEHEKKRRKNTIYCMSLMEEVQYIEFFT
ncbi:MAG: hypothetical protein ACE5LC_08625 [Candidatus Aminicenantales bacterium]